MDRATLSFACTALIVLSGVALLVGVGFIKRGRHVSAHRAAMLTATGCAALFLVLYVTRWVLFGNARYEGGATGRLLYFSLLIPHVLLATAVGPLALQLIRLAQFKREYAKHRRLARWVLPMWLFVASSGWVLYAMLYS